MHIQIVRRPSTDKCTIGTLSVDGVFQCYTLEDVVRPVKIKNETAIPAGEYQVVINFSNRFQKLLPQILNVPGFEGVRIHSGNTDADTEGCILVGEIVANNKILNSRSAFARLFAKMQTATSITLSIK